MKAPIHSVKHYVQMSRSTVTTGARNIEDIVLSVEGTTANAVDEVVEGAIVKAVFVELWAVGTVADQHFIISLMKLPSGLTDPTFNNMAALGLYSNKKNVLYTTQGLIGDDGVTNATRVVYGWFKIPKGKQRFGLGDKLKLVIASQGDSSIFYCGFFTYKEYT